MGVFDNNKLAQLDWMTQMTETIESDLNTLLSMLPDRISVSARDLIENRNSSYLSLVRNIIQGMIRKHIEQSRWGSNLGVSWEEENAIYKCFTFELKGEVEFDLRNAYLQGEIAVVKVVPTLADEDLLPLMGKRGIEAVGRLRDYGDDVSIERLNEILDILGGCADVIKSRSGKKKVHKIKNRLDEIFTTNEWRIRDMNLANKVGQWIRAYVIEGTLHNLVNLTKLKVMTYNNMPIYSIKEEK